MHERSSPDGFSSGTRQRAWLASLLLQRQSRLMPRFAAALARLRAMPRGPRRVFRRKAAATLAGAALVLALGAANFGPPGARVAHAATINVADGEIDLNAGNGACSLIEAILNANDDGTDYSGGDCDLGSGADTISLPANGNFTFDTIYAYYKGDTGTPEVTSEITIAGNNSTLDVDTSIEDMRFFAVSSSGDLTVQDLTMTDGYTRDYGGGAIINDGGQLTISACTFTNNYNSYYGGAIHTISGTTDITDSTFIHNKAESDGGGALSVLSGTLEVTNSLFTKGIYSEGNYTFAVGGAIYADNSTVTITTTTIEYSDAGDGGAIFSQSSVLTISDSIIRYNYGTDGGGIFVDGGSVEITRTTISGNEGRKGGGIYAVNADMSIDQSEISGNEASYSGGGINFRQEGMTGNTLDVTNTTVSGNEALVKGGGVYLRERPTATFNNVTIAQNSAFDGGGLTFYNEPLYTYQGKVTLNRTLISGNYGTVYADEVLAIRATITADNYNLFGNHLNNNATSFLGFTPGATDITATSDGTEPTAFAAIMAGLVDNGGPTVPATKTHALVSGSPAIDRAPDADCSAPSPTADVDQRDVARNQDGDLVPATGNECDIGAYEFVDSVCTSPVNELTTLYGAGMGSTKKAVRSTRITIPDSADLVSLYGQLAGKDVGKVPKFVRFRYPDKTFVQVNSITGISAMQYGIFWYGTPLDPTESILGSWRLAQGTRQKVQRAFILYATHETVEEYFNTYVLFDDGTLNTVGPEAPWAQHQSLTIPIDPPTAPVTLKVQIALVDNDKDSRAITVTATAGTATDSDTAANPTHGNTLSLITLTLLDVPAGTDEVVLELETDAHGDSAAIVGAAANYSCGE